MVKSNKIFRYVKIILVIVFVIVCAILPDFMKLFAGIRIYGNNVYIYASHFILVIFLFSLVVIKVARSGKNYIYLSVGVSLLITSMLSVIALIVFEMLMQGVTGWGALLYGYTNVIPPVIIGVGSILLFSILIIYGLKRVNYFEKKGFNTSSGKIITGASLGTIIMASTFMVYSVLPSLHLLPYTSVRVQGRGDEHRCDGYNVNTDKTTRLITLYNKSGPEYTPSFKLELDWRGRAILSVSHESDTAHDKPIIYYLPFEKSSYNLINGVPERINQDSEE